MKNNPWKKPELVVLTRSTPEESVLTGCKNLAPFTGPDSAVGSCAQVGCGADCNFQPSS